jgi:uncharacterized protein YjdB
MRRAGEILSVIVTVGIILFFAAAPEVPAHAAYAAETGASVSETAVTEESVTDGAVTDETITDGAITGGSETSDTIDVSDIEIDEYKDIVFIDETQELSVTVLPADATDPTISYKSSNKRVLTVNSKGVLKGVSAGKATVTISAGGLKKRITIKVRQATEYIDVDSDYLVLEKGDAHRIKAKAMPKGALQDLSYKSLDPKVAKVTKRGVVSARSVGSTSIVVSNEEMSVGITVIVNEVSAAPEGGDKGEYTGDPDSGGEGVGSVGAGTAAFVSDIKSNGRATVSAADCPTLTAEMLSAIYTADAEVEIQGIDYLIRLSGSDIVNTENELVTNIAFVNDAGDIGFLLNGGRNLPGKLQVALADRSLLKEYVYLYNDAKETYELLNVKDGDSLTLDVGGKYLMTDEKRGGSGIDPFIIGVAASAIGAAVSIFIMVKRKYWFW